MRIENKKKKIINKQKKKLMKKEKKIIDKSEKINIKNRISPIKEKIEERIPEKLTNTFEKAFEKGFYCVFENGRSLIEKSFNQEKLKNITDINSYILSKDFTNRNLKKFDKNVQKGIFINRSISTIEGTMLGLVGIGLPDIPIFIGVILKTIYEICLSYGFKYDSKEEKIYILNIICTGLNVGEVKARYSAETDKIGYNIDNKIENNKNIEKMIKETSQNLARSMIVPKFIQGIALVGAYGGVSNYKLIGNIGKIASIKYKKRFLSCMKM